MPQAYEVYPYSIDTLRRLLAQKAGTREHVIATKRHLVYFEGYFQTIGAMTILVENDYVDRDYLEDFAAYYFRCFQKYERHSVRLHFFDSAFIEADFSDLLTGGEWERLRGELEELDRQKTATALAQVDAFSRGDLPRSMTDS